MQTMLEAIRNWWNRPQWGDWAIVHERCPRCKFGLTLRRWRDDDSATERMCDNCGKHLPSGGSSHE